MVHEMPACELAGTQPSDRRLEDAIFRPSGLKQSRCWGFGHQPRMHSHSLAVHALGQGAHARTQLHAAAAAACPLPEAAVVESVCLLSAVRPTLRTTSNMPSSLPAIWSATLSSGPIPIRRLTCSSSTTEQPPTTSTISAQVDVSSQFARVSRMVTVDRHSTIPCTPEMPP
jgi:hypothetical protein